MSLSIGYSPCPNDTFLFDAWVNRKVESELLVSPQLADVETLNEWAATSKLDITKLSFPALFRNLNQYRLLAAGAALGNGVGPLLISRVPIDASDPDLANKKVILPGRSTTANLLFSFAFPNCMNKSYRVFSEIENAVLNGEADLGVIIHESRFTYAQKGLHLVKDLGTHWEEKTGCAVPLGCIAMKRSLGALAAEQATSSMQKSLQYAWNKLPAIDNYVKEHAQEMDESVMRKHIELYVNEHTRELSEKDIEAIQTLFNVYCRIEGIESPESVSLF
jgi:1,4-dihydroxy-6-naphthoate synthase